MIISTDLDPKELPPGLTLPELQAKLDKLVKGAAGLVGLFVKPLSQCSLDRSRHFAADMWPVPGRPGSVFSLATCHAARQRSSCPFSKRLGLVRTTSVPDITIRPLF
jgi:hypothetical protein